MKWAISLECLGSIGLSQKASNGYELTERSDFALLTIFAASCRGIRSPSSVYLMARLVEWIAL